MQMTVFIFITGNFKYHTEDGLSRKSRRIWVFSFISPTISEIELEIVEMSTDLKNFNTKDSQISPNKLKKF